MELSVLRHGDASEEFPVSSLQVVSSQPWGESKSLLWLWSTDLPAWG